MSACTECGAALPPAARPGRPRRYCSRACQARAYRRRRERGRLAAGGRSPTGPGTTAAGPLPGTAPDDLVRVAVELADQHGLQAVTLAAVARRVGAAPGTVHRTVGGRDRLVAAMTHAALTGGPAPPDGTDPTDPTATLFDAARREWAAYRAHPWLVTVLASTRPPVESAVLDSVQPVLAAFGALGFDPPTAFARYLALSAYVQGMAVLLAAEHRETAETGTSYPAWWTAQARRLTRRGHHRRHPWLARRAESTALPARPEIDAWFDAGLGPVIAGLTGAPEPRAGAEPS